MSSQLAFSKEPYNLLYQEHVQLLHVKPKDPLDSFDLHKNETIVSMWRERFESFQ